MQDSAPQRATNPPLDGPSHAARNRDLSPGVLERTLLTMEHLVILTDPRLEDNPIVWVNDHFCAFTGYDRSEVLGRNCRFMQGDDRDQPGRYRLRAAIDAGEACNVVLRNYKKDGTLFHNHLYVSPVSEEGEVIYFAGFQHDVAEREYALRVLRDREIHEATEQERERFGLDLHDGLGQELAGIAFMAKALHQRLAEETPAHAEAMQRLLQSIESAQESAWDLARGLSPVGASPHGLADALNRLCEQVDEVHPELACRCEVEQVAPVQPREARYLYRIAQEAVNNAVKHASASELTVSLRRVPGAVRLEVTDDGIGIPHDVLDADVRLPDCRTPRMEQVRQGMGIYSMHFRAEIVGAKLGIWPREGGGTVVQCLLPTRAGRRVAPRSV